MVHVTVQLKQQRGLSATSCPMKVNVTESKSVFKWTSDLDDLFSFHVEATKSSRKVHHEPHRRTCELSDPPPPTRCLQPNICLLRATTKATFLLRGPGDPRCLRSPAGRCATLPSCLCTWLRILRTIARTGATQRVSQVRPHHVLKLYSALDVSTLVSARHHPSRVVLHRSHHELWEEGPQRAH